MSLIKGFVAVSVLAAFLAGSLVTAYFRPQPAAAMNTPQSLTAPAPQTPEAIQAGPARYVHAPEVRYVTHRAPSERYAAESYTPTRSIVVHRKRSLKKEVLIVGGAAAGGAAIGAAAHGGRGAAVGALAGGIAGLAYDLATRNR